MNSRNEPISQAHLDAADMLKVMQKHAMLSNRQAAELFGIGQSTLLSYRSGLITMSSPVMRRIIEVLQPSAHMRVKFISACQHAALWVWSHPGERSSKKCTVTPAT